MIPDDIYRLFEIWQALMISQDQDGGRNSGVMKPELSAPCHICKQEVWTSDLVSERAHVCPLCLLPSHTACAKLVLAHCDENGLQPPADVDVDGCDCPELLNQQRLDCSIGFPHLACSITSIPGRPISSNSCRVR